MSVESNKRHALLSWVFVVVLVVLCATLGAIQYVWIGQVSRAEHDRLQGSLQSNLQRVSQDFNAEVGAVSSLFSQEFSSTDEMERESEFANRLARWRTSSRHAGLIRRVAVVVPENGSLTFRNLDLETGTLAIADWPPTWNAMRDRITARVQGGPSGRQDFGRLGYRTAHSDRSAAVQPLIRPPGRPRRTRLSRATARDGMDDCRTGSRLHADQSHPPTVAAAFGGWRQARLPRGSRGQELADDGDL